MRKFNYLKKRFISWGFVTVMLVAFMLTCSSTAFATENYNGGWAMANATQTVWSSWDSSVATRIGTIYKNEGITVLYYANDSAYIEYSTSNGPKRGYLIWQNITDTLNYSCVADVTTTSSVYYGTNSSDYQRAGTVYSGETVAVIARGNGWSYIEYNTNSGRKRGYIPSTNLYFYNDTSNMPPVYTYSPAISEWVDGSKNVYSGPSNQYTVIGSVSNETVYLYRVDSDANGTNFGYIEYYVSGTSQKKSGFIYL